MRNPICFPVLRLRNCTWWLWGGYYRLFSFRHFWHLHSHRYLCYECIFDNNHSRYSSCRTWDVEENEGFVYKGMKLKSMKHVPFWAESSFLICKLKDRRNTCMLNFLRSAPHALALCLRPWCLYLWIFSYLNTYNNGSHKKALCLPMIPPVR